MGIWTFLNDNNGALMVIVTIIYVFATIFIFVANQKSAKASKEQLNEMKRQYEDKKRLEIMPYIQFEESSGLGEHVLKLALDSSNKYSEHHDLVLKIKNIGNGTAKEITYIYEWDDCKEKYDQGAFPVQALSAEESQTIRINFACATDGKDKSANLILHYNDLLNHPYIQQLSIRYKRDTYNKYNSQSLLKLESLSTSAPKPAEEESINA